MNEVVSTSAKNDIALATFVRSLALPIRICIIRTIIENGNLISRDKLLEIPYDNHNINKHILDLKYSRLLTSTAKKKISYFSIDEEVFVKMYNRLLDLFENLRKFIDPEPTAVRNPIPVKKKARPKPLNTEQEAFGLYIKRKRNLMNLSQEDFAKHLQIERSNLSRVERGTSILNPKKLEMLAEIFEVELIEVNNIYRIRRLITLIFLIK